MYVADRVQTQVLGQGMMHFVGLNESERKCIHVANSEECHRVRRVPALNDLLFINANKHNNCSPLFLASFFGQKKSLAMLATHCYIAHITTICADEGVMHKKAMQYNYTASCPWKRRPLPPTSPTPATSSTTSRSGRHSRPWRRGDGDPDHIERGAYA